MWSTDITSIRLLTGFVYLAAILDWYSRKVLAWRLSNTLETQLCLDCLEDALRVGQLLIFNSDQGGHLPAPSSRADWPKRASGSAWMGGAEHMTISLWNAYGDQSSTQKSTPMAIRRWMRRIADCTATSSSTTTSAPIRRWATEHPPRCMAIGSANNHSRTQSRYLKFGVNCLDMVSTSTKAILDYPLGRVYALNVKG